MQIHKGECKAAACYAFRFARLRNRDRPKEAKASHLQNIPAVYKEKLWMLSLPDAWLIIVTLNYLKSNLSMYSS